MQELDKEAFSEKLSQMLRKNHILSALNDEQIYELASRATFQMFKSGETILSQGERGDTFYFILTGQIRVIDTSQRPAQLLIYLHRDDFFGERALLFDASRAATVDVVVDTKLAVFDRSTWHWLIGTVPAALEGFRKLENRYHLKSAITFPGCYLDEVVIRKDNRHILAFVATLPGPLALMIFGLGIGILLFGLDVSLPITGIVVTFFVLIGIIWIVYNYLDWVNDDFIVTSERVIHIERTIIYGESREEAPLTAIQDVSVSIPNFFTRFFGYYNITIQTAGAGNILFDGLKEGNQIEAEIFEQRTHALERIEASDTAAIRKSLVDRMGWKVGPVEASALVGTGTAPSQRLFRMPGWINYFVPKVKEETGNTIIWRKHYFILLKLAIGPITAIFIGFYLILAALFGFFPLTAPGPSLILPLVGIWALFWVWYAYQYDTWRKDVYMVNDTSIVDLKGSPFSLGSEKRREGPFGNIQNTTYTTASFFTRFLNMGDVIIETAGTADTFTFTQVYNYREVQQEISKRLLAFKEGQRKKTRAVEERRYTRWLGEYHDLAQQTGEVGSQRKPM